MATINGDSSSVTKTSPHEGLSRWENYLQDLRCSSHLSRVSLQEIIKRMQAGADGEQQKVTPAVDITCSSKDVSELCKNVGEKWHSRENADGTSTLMTWDETGKTLLPVVPLEDYFKVIALAHINEKDGHLGVSQTESKLKSMYACIPREAIQLFVKLCEVCQGQTGNIQSSAEDSASQTVTRHVGEEFPILTLEELRQKSEIVEKSDYCWVTPMLHDCQKLVGIREDVQLHLKLDNMQNTGSFKVRGIVCQMDRLMSDVKTRQRPLVTMSAGNYGKAFAYMVHKLQLNGMVLMPDTAPPSRATLIQSYGVRVEKCPTSELKSRVDRYVKEEDMLYLHPFDDPALIAGYASIGFEILSEVDNPDIVLICCGGGGSLSGTAAAISLSEKETLGHHHCRIYGVEPRSARTMYESFQHGMAVSMDTRSVAAGLSPPFAGVNTYKHCRAFVDDIILVEESEIIAATLTLFDRGIKVEPSGAAAFAALHSGKVPDVKDKRVVVVLTGGNITREELYNLR